MGALDLLVYVQGIKARLAGREEAAPAGIWIP